MFAKRFTAIDLYKFEEDYTAQNVLLIFGYTVYPELDIPTNLDKYLAKEYNVKWFNDSLQEYTVQYLQSILLTHDKCVIFLTRVFDLDEMFWLPCPMIFSNVCNTYDTIKKRKLEQPGVIVTTGVCPDNIIWK